MVDLLPIRDSKLFQSLADGEIKALGRFFGTREMEEGKTVFIENMPGESLYLVGAGAVAITKMLAEGDERTLVVLGPEDVFGEMAIVEGTSRFATARVVEKARLYTLKRDDFDRLCEEVPAVAVKLLRNITRLFTRRIKENGEEYQKMLQWVLNTGA